MLSIVDVYDLMLLQAQKYEILKVWLNEGELHVGTHADSELYRLYVDREESKPVVTVECPEWHGHFCTAEEAVDCVMSLLSGNSRLTQELRGDILAETWREVWDGSAYEQTNSTVFIQPFDDSEWVLWPGEQWRVVRTHRRFIETDEPIAPKAPPLGESLVFERIMQKPDARNSIDKFDWLTQWYGAPKSGFHWTLVGNNFFAIQLPNGWRRAIRDDLQSGVTEFISYHSPVVIRSSIYFRKSEKLESPAENMKATLAARTSFSSQEVCDLADEYSIRSWTCEFDGHELDSMLVVSVYAPRDLQIESDSLVHLIEQSISTALYIESPGVSDA